MKLFPYFLLFLIFSSCQNKNRQVHDSDSKPKYPIENSNQENRYSDEELINFLDSIGHLPTAEVADFVAYISDSIFLDLEHFNKIILQKDLRKLQLAVLDEDPSNRIIDTITAKRIFGTIKSLDHIDSLRPKYIEVSLISFDKNPSDFNDYAIILEDSHGNMYNKDVYFFKKNKLLAKRFFGNSELNHYKDKDNNTIIYFSHNITRGTGINQDNIFFYKMVDHELIPVLNVIEEVHTYLWEGFRTYTLKTDIIRTKPLTLKMNFSQSLMDFTNNTSVDIINDSTIVQYSWDEKTRSLVGNYETNIIDKLQLLSYHLDYSGFLFLNVNYPTIKKYLSDNKKRKVILSYLNQMTTYHLFLNEQMAKSNYKN